MFELIFFTSNRVKTQHAKYLCRDFNIKVINFSEKTKRANYDEPRIDNREQLLKISIENAIKQANLSGLGKNKPFIIEDTSVDIHALSRKYKKEYPGVDIKYWMQQIKFIDLDLELELLGNNRSVTIRSDLVLYFPELSDLPLYFTGTTDGKITATDNQFDTNVIYPWLDNKTFNRWFIPKNETVVISKLPIEKADLHDFRGLAFKKLLDFLESKNVIKKKSPETPSIDSNELFDGEFQCHIIVGLTCAGKTTIAQFLVNESNYLHIEASDFMHEIYRENHGVGSDVPIGLFAKELLKKQPQAVAERVINYLSKFKPQNIVITGFRLEEEVAYIESKLSSLTSKHRIVVNAERKERERRKADRNRVGDSHSIESLVDRDTRELDMGVAKLLECKQNIVINNNSDFDSLFSNYIKVLKVTEISMITKIKNKNPNMLSLRKLIVLSLYAARHNGEKSNFYSTTDICRMINTFDLSKSKYVNNVGRFFSKSVDALFEVEQYKRGKKYRLSNTGAGYAKFLLRDFQYSDREETPE